MESEMDMENEMKIPSWFTADLPAAARIWAAAAGAAGAFAPRHIADALIEGRNLFEAALEGTRRATEEAGEGWPPPRGCEILIFRGRAALVWKTERHQIFLEQDRLIPEDWLVTIHCYHTPGDCERVIAAEAMEASL